MIDKISKNQEVIFSYYHNYKKIIIESKIFLDFDLKLWDIIYLKYTEDEINKTWISEFLSASFISISKTPKKWHEKYWILLFHNWPGCHILKENDFLYSWEWYLIREVYLDKEITYQEFYERICNHKQKINLKSQNLKKELIKHPIQKMINILEILYQVKNIQESINKQFTEQTFVFVWRTEDYLTNLSFLKLLECFDILSFSMWWDGVVERMKKIFNSLENNEMELIINMIKIYDFWWEVIDYEEKIKLLIDIRNFSTHWWYSINIPVKQRKISEAVYIWSSNNKTKIYWYENIFFHINTIDILYFIVKELLLKEIKKIDL